MSELSVAVVSFIGGAFATLFLAPYEWRSWVLHRRMNHTVNENDLIQIAFINRRGENIFLKDDANVSPADTYMYYKLRLHFRLRALDELNLTTIEVNYPRVSDSHIMEVKHKVNGEGLLHDGNYGFLQPIKLGTETVINVQLSLTFRGNRFDVEENGDYGPFEIRAGFTSRRLNGFHVFLVEGELQAGGEARLHNTQILLNEVI